jgi:hypothetical protein
MRVLAAIAALILAIGPVASGSSTLQSSATKQRVAERVVVLAVQGMT